MRRTMLVKEHATEQALDGHEHLGHVAVRQGHYSHAPVGKLPVERRAVSEVAAQPIQAFCEYCIETARFGGAHQVLQTRAVGHRRARDRCVGEFSNDKPSLSAGMLPRQSDLVGYRSGVLEVGAEPGINGDAHGDVPSLACSAA